MTNLRKVSFFSLERVNKLQMENSFSENKQISEKEIVLHFASLSDAEKKTLGTKLFTVTNS